jgi:SulP family sulfate permease
MFHVFGTYRPFAGLSSRSGSPEQPGREPANTIAKAFSYDPEFDSEKFKSLVNYLERQTLPEGHVLFKQGDISDALYVIESGVLRALYRFAEHVPCYRGVYGSGYISR